MSTARCPNCATHAPCMCGFVMGSPGPMGAPNPAEVIAEALAKHQPRQIWPGNTKLVCRHPDCYSCDWTPAHQASAIAALPDIAVLAFIRERQEYVDAARATVETNADYFRWQGHMEARRQLAQKLGLPYEFESAGGES